MGLLAVYDAPFAVYVLCVYKKKKVLKAVLGSVMDEKENTTRDALLLLNRTPNNMLYLACEYR